MASSSRRRAEPKPPGIGWEPPTQSSSQALGLLDLKVYPALKIGLLVCADSRRPSREKCWTEENEP